MELTSQVEAIKNELTATQSTMPDTTSLSEVLRAELNALWMAVDAVAAAFDDDKRALGL
jgi:hypothetical protein